MIPNYGEIRTKEKVKYENIYIKSYNNIVEAGAGPTEYFEIYLQVPIQVSETLPRQKSILTNLLIIQSRIYCLVGY